MKEIPLKICKSSCHYNPPESASAMVDDEDYEILMAYTNKWYLNVGGYAVATKDQERMHRVIMGLKRGDPLIDHDDTNRLNNQKYNLIISTRRENIFNISTEPRTSSGYKGVYKIGSMWRMLHKLGGIPRYSETYICKHAAAYAYNKLINTSMGDRGYRNDLSNSGFTIEQLEQKLITDRSSKRGPRSKVRPK